MSSIYSSGGNIPFSWENKPGIRKLETDRHSNDEVVQGEGQAEGNSEADMRKLPGGSLNEKNTFQQHPPAANYNLMRSCRRRRTSLIAKGANHVRIFNDYEGEDKAGTMSSIKLRPPPASASACDHENYCFPNNNKQHLVIPLPPLPSSSRKGLGIIISRKEDDPFLMAYKECTKNTTFFINNNNKNNNKNKSLLGSISCKQSCSVRDDSIVRVSQAP